MKKIAIFLLLIFAVTLAACAQQAPAAVPTPEPELNESGLSANADEQTVEMITGVVVEITE